MIVFNSELLDILRFCDCTLRDNAPTTLLVVFPGFVEPALGH